MKLLHLSDLHFGRHHEHIIPAFLADLAFIKPELILISGDLTHRATTRQYQQLQAFLAQLPCPAFCVPGNHDIPLHHLLARMFFPFRRYYHYVNKQLEICFENETIRLMGVNSVNPHQIKDGILTLQTIQNIHHFFASSDKCFNLLFFHHNFDYLEDLHKPLANEQQFLTCLQQSAINLVCTGHLHYAHVNLLEKKEHYPCLILHAGSLLCQRTRDGFNSYFVLDVDDQHCHVDWRIYQDDQSFVSKASYSLNCAQPHAVLTGELQALQ